MRTLPLCPAAATVMLAFMKTQRPFEKRLSLLCGLVLAMLAMRRGFAEPTQTAILGFDRYVAWLESRLIHQHGSHADFIAMLPREAERLRAGQQIVEQLSPPDGGSLPGAMLHHWRGTAFAPGATVADFEHFLRDFDSYPKRFAPQVTAARVVAPRLDGLEAWMRVRQKHVITVVMDGTYDVSFGRLDASDGFSISRSVRIYEIDSSGKALGAAEEHGFLWRLNSYWSYEERDGGLYIQVESVSLSRSIPTGLGWAIRPYVESVPRESLEFTLHSACDAVRR